MARLAIGALAGGIAALALSAGVAGAVGTSATLSNPEFGVYTGKVSANKPCAKGRTVEVWHDTNGNGKVDGDPPDFKIGSTTTNKKGRYTVQGNQAPPGDNLIAVVQEKASKKCKGAQAQATAQAHDG